MAHFVPHTAMVLAAGLGTRMRPLTLTTPKPLLEVGGVTMLDRAFDRLKAIGVQRVVVNVSWLAEQITDHLVGHRDIKIIISPEVEPLETGGGIKHALQYLGDDPVYIINADLPWEDPAGDPAAAALARLAAAWDAGKMDALLLVMKREKARGFGSKGDFVLERDGRLDRAGVPQPLPYVFISAQIVQPEIYRAVPDKKFSNNVIFNQAEVAGRLYGVEHSGACYHIGTPADLTEANRLLASGAGWTLP
jgi:N-acetyl-alpha-D-muramate 1-phosphate uridylyltransferase